MLFQLDMFQAPDPQSPDLVKIRLPDPTMAELLSYDRVVITFSGGKDSVAQFLHCLEIGIPRSKIELWHHCVDGNPYKQESDLMDWPCTTDYCRKFAEAFDVPIFFTWKVGGFEREMCRENALTAPICFEEPLFAHIKHNTPKRIRETGGTRGKLNTRRKFPQIAADLSVRWCSAYLKIDNAKRALANQDRFRNSRTLFLTGERAEESPGRAHYARFEVNGTDARKSKALKRHIDHWRPVHDWDELKVWQIMKRWKVNPHPAYKLGWSRCSCAACIFGSANMFASLRLINLPQFEQSAGYEQKFERTMKRNISLPALADSGVPFDMDAHDIEVALNSIYSQPIFVDTWEPPKGAFGENAGPI